MASLHHLSLGLQNATLGTFAGDGFRRFGLESCWGSAVSQPRSTELLGAVSELCSREFFADEVATSTEAAPGNGIIASSFFRASERNVRHFCGRWFSQVWAWILLGFCCFATTHYWAPWGCFGAMLREFLADEVATSTGAAPGNGIIASSFFRSSERNVREALLRAMVFAGLGLNPAGVLLFRNHALLSSLVALKHPDRRYHMDMSVLFYKLPKGNGYVSHQKWSKATQNGFALRG